MVVGSVATRPRAARRDPGGSDLCAGPPHPRCYACAPVGLTLRLSSREQTVTKISRTSNKALCAALAAGFTLAGAISPILDQDLFPESAVLAADTSESNLTSHDHRLCELRALVRSVPAVRTALEPAPGPSEDSPPQYREELRTVSPRSHACPRAPPPA